MAAFGSDVDPAIYRERILPKLAAVKLVDIMEATGYSKGALLNDPRRLHLDTARLDLASASSTGRARP